MATPRTKDENIIEKVTTDYNIEGAAVGYKWFDLKGHKPLFPFGYGLSYSSFALEGLSAKTGRQRHRGQLQHQEHRQARWQVGGPSVCVAGQRRLGSA